MMKVALIQQAYTQNKEEMLVKSVENIKEAAREGALLVV